MPVIDIHHPHALGKQRCHDAIDSVAHDLAARFGLGDLTWQDDALIFARPGVTGRLEVGAADAHVHLQLGPMLGLLSGSIEAEIRRALDRCLA